MTADFKEYDNAVAFRRALEDRLKNIAREQSIPLDRLRRRITFDRFLARLFRSNTSTVCDIHAAYNRKAPNSPSSNFHPLSCLLENDKQKNRSSR